MDFEEYINRIQVMVFLIMSVSFVILYLYVVFPRAKRLFEEAIREPFWRSTVLAVVLFLGTSLVVAAAIIGTSYLLALVKLGILHSQLWYESVKRQLEERFT